MSKKIIRVNMNKLEANYEDLPEKYQALGGRGLTSTIVADEVPPTCHPLGPNNKVVLAPGIVTGTNAPSSGRISVGGKSPLTGGIKEANAGTDFGQKLGRLRIGAIIIEGQSEGKDYYLLKITNDGAELKNANKWVGKGLYEVYKDIRKEFGEKISICGVGIAAELRGGNSGLSFNDPEGLPSRYAGRGGLGAVMASRGLKFIIVDDTGAPGVSVWALGPNCEIYDLDTIGELNRAINDLGMDTIETGDTIAVAMEGGLIEFGDGKGAIKLLEEIRKKTPTGRILVNGTEFTGKAFGVTRIPTVKGQSMPAYDPRAIKGIGVTYATSPMGADHTAGYAIATEIMGVGGTADRLEPKKAELSRNLQVATAVVDSTGYCLFIAFAILDIVEGLQGVVDSVNGVLGANLTLDDIPTIGMQILETEIKFNKAAGFTSLDDRLPEFMKEEKLPPDNEVFNVTDEELDSVFKF